MGQYKQVTVCAAILSGQRHEFSLSFRLYIRIDSYWKEEPIGSEVISEVWMLYKLKWRMQYGKRRERNRMILTGKRRYSILHL